MRPGSSEKNKLITTMLALTRQRHVAVYFLLTIAISWGGIFTILSLSGTLDARKVSEDIQPFLYLFMLLGPGLASIISTIIVDGRSGLNKLVKLLAVWRVQPRYYLLALFTAPVLITASLLLCLLISPAFMPVLLESEDKLSLLVTGLAIGLVVGVFEELGWTGFAAEKLRVRFGVMLSGLVIGIIWGVWHLPLFLGAALSSEIPAFLYLIVLLCSFLPAYRILMVWLYSKSNSLLLAVLMHAPLAGSQLILIPVTLNGNQIIAFDLILGIALWVLVLLSRKL